jgi:hypothetical protein
MRDVLHFGLSDDPRHSPYLVEIVKQLNSLWLFLPWMSRRIHELRTEELLGSEHRAPLTRAGVSLK